MSVVINTRRLTKRQQDAQKYLDTRVMRDCTRFVSIKSGTLRNSVNLATVPGSGKVTWRTPYAHYQFIGKDMVGVETGRHWAKKYEPKEYNGKLLHYQESEATAQWFETAQGIYGKSWEDGVERILGGQNGNR